MGRTAGEAGWSAAVRWACPCYLSGTAILAAPAALKTMARAEDLARCDGLEGIDRRMRLFFNGGCYDRQKRGAI